MYSPRKKNFFKEFASSIRSERVLKQRQPNEDNAEIHALQGRLMRLFLWEHKLEQLWNERENKACIKRVCTI